MIQQQQNDSQAREERFLSAILAGTLNDPEVDDPRAIALADAIILQSILN